MPSNLGSFDQSPLGAFIQSALGARDYATAYGISTTVFFGGDFTDFTGVTCVNGAARLNTGDTGEDYIAASIAESSVITALAIYRDALYAAWYKPLFGDDRGVKAWNINSKVFENISSPNSLTSGYLYGLAADDDFLVICGYAIGIDGSGSYSVCQFDGDQIIDISPDTNLTGNSVILCDDGDWLVTCTPSAATGTTVGTIYKGYPGGTWVQSQWEIECSVGASPGGIGIFAKNIGGTIFIFGDFARYRAISGPGSWVNVNSVCIYDPVADSITSVGTYSAGLLEDVSDVDKAGNTLIAVGANGVQKYAAGDWSVIDDTANVNICYRLNDGTVLIDFQSTLFDVVVGNNLYQLGISLTPGLYHSGTCNGQISAAIDVGAITMTDQFKITVVVQSYGFDEGGESRTITGGGFTAGAVVTWDGSNLGYTLTSQSVLTITTPASAGSPAGNITVEVTQYGITKSTTFTYRHLTISSINPISGPTAGGTSVTINGTWLSANTDVYFGGTIATNIVYNGKAGTITCDTPAHAAGAVDVLIVDGVASDTLSGAYTYT